MLYLRGFFLVALIAVAATVFAPSARAQQTLRDCAPLLTEARATFTATRGYGHRRKGRRLRGVWTCYQSPGERCCYNSVTGQEFCTGWPPR